MYVRVAVGYETLHAVEQPAAVLFGICRTEHHALQVASGIRLGEIHGHGFAGADTRNVLLPLLLVAELVKGLDAVLKTPYVFKPCVARRNYFVCKSVCRNGEIKTAIPARHGHSVHPRSYSVGEVLLCALGVAHTSVLEVRAFGINALGIGGHDICRYIAHDFEHTVVAVHCVVEVNGRIIVFCRIRIVAFAESDNLFHKGVIQMELQFRLI